jgi:signal transduction histidine kinase
MTNLLQFPQAAYALEPEVGAAFLVSPAVHSHAVQFYESDSFLFDTVGQFLAAGLAAGDQMVVIATPEHREGFMERLQPHGPGRAVEEGRLLLLDARLTLSQFMVEGMPDADLFRRTIKGILGTLNAANPHARVRAYGEMVDLLWRDGNSRAAIRLEELWNDAGNDHAFALLCAYVMGNFYKEGDTTRFLEVCRNHSHVIPTETFTRVDDANARLREISLLQQRARALESEIAHRRDLEDALRDALGERSRVEEELRACVQREKEARERAEASDTYKEMFLGILGHDLRNPLNTILTTARLMRLRGDLGPDADKRIDRMVSSGVRMERMIAQLLDVTRARHADGIPVTRAPGQDLAQIVRKIVDEIRATHPKRRIDLQADGTCRAHLDADRFEQVISNLVGNAITHGDPGRPITIRVGRREEMAFLTVHNFGPAIDSGFLPVLFDPFSRRQGCGTGDGGLGLGLYIAERIVSAHGGRISVDSTVDGGTCFEVVVPVGGHA